VFACACDFISPVKPTSEVGHGSCRWRERWTVTLDVLFGAIWERGALGALVAQLRLGAHNRANLIELCLALCAGWVDVTGETSNTEDSTCASQSPAVPRTPCTRIGMTTRQAAGVLREIHAAVESWDPVAGDCLQHSVVHLAAGVFVKAFVVRGPWCDGVCLAVLRAAVHAGNAVWHKCVIMKVVFCIGSEPRFLLRLRVSLASC
jgi:hypothetical protein